MAPALKITDNVRNDNRGPLLFLSGGNLYYTLKLTDRTLQSRQTRMPHLMKAKLIRRVENPGENEREQRKRDRPTLKIIVGRTSSPFAELNHDNAIAPGWVLCEPDTHGEPTREEAAQELRKVIDSYNIREDFEPQVIDETEEGAPR